MAYSPTKTAVKAILCLLLCIALAQFDWPKAVAQTSNPAPPAVSGGPVAASPAPAIPAPLPAPLPAPPNLPAPGQTLAGVSPPVAPVSVLGMVRNSDPIVQAIMVFLVVCSAASWAVFIYKSIVLAIARRSTHRFSLAFRNAGTMDDVEAVLKPMSDGPAPRMWWAAKAEWDLTLGATGTPLAAHQINRLLQRLVLAMGSSQERSLSRLGNWMGLLATVGSTAPFIGLFGTVWGILDSFEHISASYNTSLTVVAPGIAEALLATAAGLFAAIPATMFYNRFAREIGKLTGMLDNITAELIVFASRDVERLGK